MATDWERVGAEGVRHLATDLRALADFLPTFRQADFKAGGWADYNQTKPGPVTLPPYRYAPVVGVFYEAASGHGWVKAFDWFAWAASEEAKSLWEDETAIRSATPEQLANLLTVCFEADRFSEGFLSEAFESGRILRILERAAVLAGEMSAP
ncbi:DUF6508 domain-containing protein [Zavarzinia compransoris]|uniref:Uncharacterized protein n=1 Tax=Zavarzinia compransoris TaxID=1264899 RepID=A0A317E1R4_9PROT|nr:DUF6508 domain-containing protein [Zavarzinia compransoris]PWR20581.1 hypothetical protein DKG75_11270 [Zavarzinia compransoris]TDP43773.1 hypothetical protein DES42_10929 [Zavarzinia compransoris]